MLDRKTVVDLATKWLATKATKMQSCPCCGSKNWQLGHVVGLATFDYATQIFDTTKLMANVALHCGSCGMRFLFDARIVGMKE